MCECWLDIKIESMQQTVKDVVDEMMWPLKMRDDPSSFLSASGKETDAAGSVEEESDGTNDRDGSAEDMEAG